MEEICELIRALNPQQIRLLKKYLRSFSMRSPDTKLFQLAVLVIRNPHKEITLEKASMKLYGEYNFERIKRLKHRLKEKIMDILITDINLKSFNYSDEIHEIQLRLRKKMMLYDLIKFSDLRDVIGLNLLNDVIRDARKYEFFPILLDALNFKKWIVMRREGFEEYNRMQKDIEFYEQARLSHNLATDRYTELGLFSTFNPNASKQKLETFIQSSILELGALYKKFGVASVLYWTLNFEKALAQIRNDFYEAIRVSENLVKLLNGNVVLQRKMNYGVAYSDLAQFQAQAGQYAEALENVKKGRMYFDGMSLNIALSKKLEFEIQFLMGNYSEASTIIRELTGVSKDVTGNFRHDILLFYKACSHFALKNFKEAGRLLNLKYELAKDKIGWEMNLRFMRIMNAIEMELFDEAYNMVQAFEKYMARHTKNKDICLRDRMIYHLFHDLSRQGFMFGRPTISQYSKIIQLLEIGKAHSWESMGTELVRVDHWIRKRFRSFVPPSGERRKRKRSTVIKAKSNA